MTVSITMTDKIRNLIIDNWKASQTPEINPVWTKRTVGFIDDRRDQILITPKQENITYYGLYGLDHLHEITLDLDIRTYQNVQRHSDIITEVMRIIKNNIRGGNEYVDLQVLNSVSRNQNMRNMFNHIVTISFRVHIPHEFTSS